MTTAAASSLDHAMATNIHGDGGTTLGLIPGSQAAQSAAEFTHLCLSFGDCVDALPPSLTRSISDLRELDAVLSGSLSVITGKLTELLCLLEDKTATPLRRFELLREIAEEARAFRLGGEDKIRVATGTCETLIHNTTQLDLLANLLTTLLPASMAGTIPPPTWPHGYPVLFPAPASASGSAYRRPDFLPASHAYGKATSGIYSAHASGMASGYGSTTNNSGIYPSLGGGGTFGAGSLYANSVTTPAYDAPGLGGRQAANYAAASDAVRQYARAGVPLADPDEVRAQIRLDNKTGPLKAWQEPPHHGGASKRNKTNGHADSASIASGGGRKRKVAGSSTHDGHYGGHSLGTAFGQDPYMVNSAMFAHPQSHFGHPAGLPPYTMSAPPTAALVAPGSLAAQQQQNLGTGLGQPSSTSVLPQQAGTGHARPAYDMIGHPRQEMDARHAMAAGAHAARYNQYPQPAHPGHIPYHNHSHQSHHHHAIPEGVVASNDSVMMAPLPKKRRSAVKKVSASDHADGDHAYEGEENGEIPYAAGNGHTAMKRDRNNSSRGSQGIASPVVPPGGPNLAHINTAVTNGNGAAKRSRASAKRQRSGDSPDVGSGNATPVSGSFANSRRRGSQMDLENGAAAPRNVSSRRGAGTNGASTAAAQSNGAAAEAAPQQVAADAAMELVEEEAAYGEDGEGDGDGADDRTYCYCNRVSFGNMIGCDDNECAREWFHLSCVGLTDPPKGEWYCDECRNRRNATTASKKRR